ncbi:unnamed protein product [Choristocarpus tenellus]
MGSLNDGVHEHGGVARGVIHRMWIVDNSEHTTIDDLRVVDGDWLQERKRALVEEADCIIALPGGPGTWDELFEMVCLKGIGICNLPICAVDVNGFYEGLRTQLERAHGDGILYAHPSELLHFEPNAEAALAWCTRQLGDASRPKMKMRAVAREPVVQDIRRLNGDTVASARVWMCAGIVMGVVFSLTNMRWKMLLS